MKTGLFNKRIPTFFALVVLVIVIAISTILIQSGIFYVSKAASDTQPLNFSVTNITDSSFTVIFTTTGFVEAAVAMQNSTGNSLILDDRDKKTGAQNKYYSHHITIPNLTPNSSYSYKLLIGGKEYTSPSYNVKTGSAISTSPPTQNPLFGKVLLPDGSDASDTIIIAKTNTSQLVSAVTNNKGQFIIPTNSLRDTTNNQYVILSDNVDFMISAIRQNMKTDVNATFSVAQNLPSITLLQQYTFFSAPQPTLSISPALNFQLPITSSKTVDIVNPRQGESFIDQRPLFSGTSYPNSTVAISLKSGLKTSVITDVNGDWYFQPNSNLAQGNNSISIKVSDLLGNIATATKSFSIFPPGSQVADSATPSATPIFQPTATPTVTPTPTPTPNIVTDTPTPIIAITNTPTPIASITATLTPTAIITTNPTLYLSPTKLPPINNPGSTQNSLVLTGVSIVLIIAGSVLLFAL